MGSLGQGARRCARLTCSVGGVGGGGGDRARLMLGLDDWGREGGEGERFLPKADTPIC